MSELHAIPAYARYLPPDGDELTALITLQRDSVAAGTGAGQLTDLELRVRTPQVARVISVEQVAPATRDLTTARLAITEQVAGYPSAI